jgi:16S rRNA G966 N2-methylase RsmD
MVVVREDFDMDIKKIHLDNSFEVLYVEGLDGGGYDYLPDFKNAIALTGKKHYTSGVEWCAGYGVLGFDLLKRGVCDHMSFIDCHEPAKHWLNETIKHNIIEHCTTVYLADKILLIPNEVKWDLVIANPPHSFEIAGKKMFEDTLPKNIADVVIRLVCDVDFTIHKEFFANIRKHLLPGADLFISETNGFDIIEQLAMDAGLQIIGQHPADKLRETSSPEAIVFHFKEPS